MQHFIHQTRRQLARLQKLHAGFGRDDEARGHVEADSRHFTKVCTFASQKSLVLSIAFTERIDIALIHGSPRDSGFGFIKISARSSC